MGLPIKVWFSAAAGLFTLILSFVLGKNQHDLKMLKQQQKANHLKNKVRHEREVYAKKIDDAQGVKSAAVASSNVADALNELFHPKN